jgi:type II secretory pathway pseudopilin PulG
MNARGASLIETVAALAILGIALAAAVPAFMLQMETNTFAEHHSGAVAAAQRVMEDLRFQDPSLMPSAGASSPQSVAAGSEVYEVITRYCVNSDYCDTNSRHVRVEVYHDGQEIYAVESVFTLLL